jgi:hypothetical protein
MTTESLEVLMARLEGGYAQIDRRLATIETDLRDLRSEIRGEIGGLRGEFGGLRGEIGELRRDMLQQFYWVVGLIVATILVPIALRFLPSVPPVPR